MKGSVQYRQSLLQMTDPSGNPIHGGKRLQQSSKGPRNGFWCKSLGLALFVACPYIHHAGMMWCAGYPGEKVLLVTGPLLIDLLAIYLYQKGGKQNAD